MRNIAGSRDAREKPRVNQRRQVLATRGGELKAFVRSDLAISDDAGESVKPLWKMRCATKKSRAGSPALKIVSTLFPRKFDLILIGGATLLVRVRVPPETWTTRLDLAASLSPHW